MREIEVNVVGEGLSRGFEVEVREGASRTTHRVTMSEESYRSLTGGRVPPEACVRAAFGFLLDREPKEAILPTFDITVISRYFPEFPRALPGYFPPPEGRPRQDQPPGASPTIRAG